MFLTGLFYTQVIFLPGARGQSYDQEHVFRGGITAGANVSELIGDAWHGYHKPGFHGGFIVYAMWGHISSSLEILYSQRGSRGVREVASVYAGSYFEKYYLDLNYVEIPLQAHLYVHKASHVGVGLSWSGLIDSREEIATDQPVHLQAAQHPFSGSDLAFVGSINWALYKRWFVTVRYQHSLRPVREARYVPYNMGSGNQYNTWFSVRLMYLFR